MALLDLGRGRVGGDWVLGNGKELPGALQLLHRVNDISAGANLKSPARKEAFGKLARICREQNLHGCNQSKTDIGILTGLAILHTKRPMTRECDVSGNSY